MTLLLDTLPMLGNVLMLSFLIFFVFGIIGVQLWQGKLRNRCFTNLNESSMFFTRYSHSSIISCSKRTSDPFLESPYDFPGPKPNIQVKMQILKARVLTNKPAYLFVLSCYRENYLNFTFNCKQKQISGPR